MFKKIWFCIAAMLVAASTSQAVIIYQNNLNSWGGYSTPPSGWTIVASPNSYWDDSDWHRGTLLGAYCAELDYWGDYGYNQTDDMISPLIDCGGFINVSLRCRTYFSHYCCSYTARLEGSANGGATWPYVIRNYYGTQVYGSYENFSVPWANGCSNVRFRWHFYGDPWNINYWAFDDVVVEGIPGAPTPAEIAIWEILGIADYITSGIPYTPRATVRNTGGETANNIAVACTIRTHDGTVDYHSEKTIASLGAYAQTTVTFDDWTPESYCGEEYTIKVSTDFEDDHPENNSKEMTALITAVILVYYNFDTGNDGFTSQRYLSGSWVNDWEWGQPTYGPSAYSPPNCWATRLKTVYSNLSSSRLLSPIITDFPPGTKAVSFEFWHWYYIESYWDGGNVKISKDGGSFEIIEPIGGYSGTTYNYGLPAEPAYFGSATSWRRATFREIPITPTSSIQFAFDFGSDYSVQYYGWYIDDVMVLTRYPPIVITDIGNIPALVGVNCCYIPTVRVKNQWKEMFRRVDVLRRIGRPDEGTEYEGYQMIAELAKDAEEEVTLDEWCAPSEPGITFYDSIFAGVTGLYLDTLVRFFETGVNLGNHHAEEPIDSIYTNTTYYPMATINLALGCDAPYSCTLQLRDSVANVIYLAEGEGFLSGPKEHIFDSLSVEEPGWYVFVLVARTPNDATEKDDTLRWEVLAKHRGALDVGTDAIDMPDRLKLGESIAPEATVENYGQVATSFDVECKIEPGVYVDTKAVTNLQPGATYDVGFLVWEPLEPGEYTVTVTTMLSGDADPANDSKTHTINVVGIAEEPAPSKFELSCIRPNPFSINTEISYQLPHSSRISLAVYDISGKLVKTLVTGTKDAGSYAAVWDGRDSSGKNMAAGLYFVKLLTPEYKATRKVVLLVR